MSENKEIKFNNPLINFITDAIREIYFKLNTIQIVGARRRLYHLVCFLDPVVKEELKDTIKTIEDIYHGNTSNTLGFIMLSNGKNIDEQFRDCLQKVSDALYRAGYLSAQTYVRGS